MIMEASSNRIEAPLAILGWGASGQGAASLALRQGLDFDVFDERDIMAAHHEFTIDDAKRYKTVVYSPGFRNDHRWLQLARDANCLCMGEIEYAAQFWKGPVIAVTGTNGKTTISSFLAYALRNSGVPAIAAGNIGNSFSRLFEVKFDTPPTAVCEISSFQSEALNDFRADVLIWTNFTEDHIDRPVSANVRARALAIKGKTPLQ